MAEEYLTLQLYPGNKGSLIKSQIHFPIKSFYKCSAQELSLEAQITTSAIESHAMSGWIFVF